MNICVYESMQTEREQVFVCGQCVYMYSTFYSSLSIQFKESNIFCMALKVSVLVFYPLFILTPMNNQQRIKLKSKQHLLHVLEEVNASFCKMWMCPVYELGTLKAYDLNTDFFPVMGSVQLLLMSVGTFLL